MNKNLYYKKWKFGTGIKKLIENTNKKKHGQNFS